MTPLQKNTELTVTIQSLGYNGEGISKDFEIPIFVPFALLGEHVSIKIILIKKQFAIGKLLRVLVPSPYRVKAPCVVFGKCGGCDLQHLAYAQQLAFKQNHVTDCFKKIGGISVHAKPTIASKHEFAYRNKFSLPIRAINEAMQLGFFAPNSHRIVPFETCHLQEQWAMQALSVLKTWVERHGISVYNEQTLQGVLRHFVARCYGNQLQVALVINGKELPHLNVFYQALTQHFETVSLYTNQNTSQSNVIFGKTFVHAFGAATIADNILGLTVPVVPASFMQVNNAVRDAIYSEVLAHAFHASEVIIDAYSGAGTLTNLLALKHRQQTVYGIEIVHEAVQAAIAVASANGITNAQHILGDCEEVLPQLIKQHASQRICLVLDPPRKGCTPNMLIAAVQCGVGKIIYISCDPATLARDIKTIMEAAAQTNQLYTLDIVQPYDMFPQTKHVETLVVLTKQS